MANNIYKKKDIKLDTFEDLNCKGVIASFSQGDRVSDKLLLRLTNDGVALDLTDATQVRIDFRKPDGKLVFQYCIMEDKPNGLISAVLTTQTLAAPGKVYAEVTVKYPEGKDVVTRQFTFHVEAAIAGDKSIQSQNEWPMLERAIVAGDMLAGVDLVAIIKAGELAAAALPKTGGTMTGNLNIENGLAVQWFNGNTRLFQLYGADNSLALTDIVGSQSIWQYNPVTKTFSINAATNVVKKSGDTLTGQLTSDVSTANIGYGWKGGVTDLGLISDKDGFWRLRNYAKGKDVFSYNATTEQMYFNADSNLLKTTGGTITGAMTFDAPLTIRGSAASWDMRPHASGVYSKGVRHTINVPNNYYAVAPIDATGAATWANQMALYGDTGVFDVKDLNIRGGSASNVVTKLKDGQFNLPLTNDATNANSGYMPIADRRGNTVTVRMEVTRNVGATSTVVCSLPAELRPANTLSYNFLANDGSLVGVNFKWDGSIEMFTTGKTVKIVATYVVN